MMTNTWLEVTSYSRESVPKQLEDYLTKFAEQSFDSSSEPFELSFSYIEITPTILARMVQLLRQTLPTSDTPHGDKESKWLDISFSCCKFQQQEPSQAGGTTPKTKEPMERPCTPDEMQDLFLAVAQRTRDLSIVDSPDILSGWLMTAEHDPHDLESLYIDQSQQVSAVAYERLAEFIRRCPQMKNLFFQLPFREAPLAIYETLASLIYLQQLGLTFTDNFSSNLLTKEEGAVARLLQNPQSRLQELRLQGMAMSDRDFIEVVRMLPQTQIQYLDVGWNHIHLEGIIELARQLPNLQTLRIVRVRRNPWTEPDTTSLVTLEECGTALVKGMMENYSVEYLDILEAYSVEYVDKLEDEDADPPPETWLKGSMKTLESSPEMTLLMHYATLNQAGRRLLISSSPVPLGLWPLVLERAGTTLEYPFFYNDSEKQQQFKANAVYYLLRQSPMIFENVH